MEGAVSFSFVFPMSAIWCFSSYRALLRAPEILSGYSEGQIFSLMEGKRTCETQGHERERVREMANQREG